VVVTFRKNNESTSRTVVSNVQVLTAGSRSDNQKRSGAVAQSAAAVAAMLVPQPAVVTLLVTPSDAERIALAQAEGHIMLVLRNPLDSEPTVTTGARTAALVGEETAPAPVPVMRASRRAPAVVTEVPAPVPPPPYRVEAIRAAKRTEEEVVR
jgi:pilus assembly protein CpaB